MVTNSKFIAGLIGPTLVAAGATVLLNQNLFPGVIGDILHNPALVMLAGFVTFVAGLAIVRLHNQWHGGWPVLVTIIGWLCIIGGLVRILFPVQLAEFAMQFILMHDAMPLAAVVMFIVGGFLSYKAYGK